MNELKTSVRTKSLRWTLGAFGGGAGIVLGIAAIRALTSRPEFLPQLLSGGFLGFAALIFGMVMVDRKAERFLAAQERALATGEQLASNVGKLAEKVGLRDEAMEQRWRELELTANHTSRQTDTILQELKIMRSSRGGN